MSSMTEVQQCITEMGKAFTEFKDHHDTRLKEMENEILKLSAPDGAWSPRPATKSTEQFINTKTGAPLPVLSHQDKLADLLPDGQKKSGNPSVGRLMRGIVMGGLAKDAGDLAEERKALGIAPDPSGGYTVSGSLSSEWIDLLRAQMVLSRAGCRTLPMDSGQVTLARVTGDPEIFWKAENAAIAPSDPTFGAVTLDAKTAVCLVRLSLELSQDSANIEQILQTTIINAMARAIDGAGLNGTLPQPSGIVHRAGRNTVTGIGAPASYDFLVDGVAELLVDNVALEDIGAMIAHPLLWKKLAKLRTGISDDETPLKAPDEIAKIPKLWTTAAPLTGGNTATAVIGDWRDLLLGVRQNITVQVLNQTFLGSNLQVAVLAHARVDFQPVRLESFCTMENITV